MDSLTALFESLSIRDADNAGEQTHEVVQILDGIIRKSEERVKTMVQSGKATQDMLHHNRDWAAMCQLFKTTMLRQHERECNQSTLQQLVGNPNSNPAAVTNLSLKIEQQTKQIQAGWYTVFEHRAVRMAAVLMAEEEAEMAEQAGNRNSNRKTNESRAKQLASQLALWQAEGGFAA